MLNKYIYIQLIAVFFLSCSDKDAFEGRWVLSQETLESSIGQQNVDETYRDKELNQKLSLKLNSHIVYSFDADGVLRVHLESDADSIKYAMEAKWRSDENFLFIKNINGKEKAFSYDFNGNTVLLTDSLDLENSILLNRFSN